MFMGRTTKLDQVNFVAPPKLLREVREAAEKMEKPISEWIRDALREKLARGAR
jgi:hypothetical protein